MLTVASLPPLPPKKKDCSASETQTQGPIIPWFAELMNIAQPWMPIMNHGLNLYMYVISLYIYILFPFFTFFFVILRIFLIYFKNTKYQNIFKELLMVWTICRRNPLSWKTDGLPFSGSGKTATCQGSIYLHCYNEQRTGLHDLNVSTVCFVILVSINPIHLSSSK